MSSLILATIAKATLVLGAAALLAFLGRRTTAARRHLLWVLAIGAVLVLPAAEWLGPEWPVVPWPARPAAAAPAPVEPIPQIVASATPARPTPAPAPNVAAPTSTPTPAPARATSRPVAIGVWLFAGWLTGLGVVLGGLLIGRRRLARLAARATRVTAPAWRHLCATLRAELGLRREVTLLTASGPAMPMTWGTRHPVILLPAEAFDWSAERRRDVLLHELAHVQRRDCLTQLLALGACALYWFHPLVWLAAARLRVERERACDDRVLSAGSKPSAYAAHLLEIARSLRVGPVTALTTLAMARPSQLSGRLLDVLDPARRREALTRRLSMSGACAAALVVLPLAAARPVRHAPPVHPKAAAAGPVQAGAKRSRLAAPPVRVAPDTGWCSGDTRSSHSNNTSSGGTRHLELHYQDGRCDTELQAEGTFTFSADFTDIAAIAAGGSVVVQRRADVTRRVELRPGADGTVQRRWFVADHERPYDAEARAWLAAVLTDLLRHTGYAAAARSRWLLDTRGVSGLFEEIAQLEGDYARRIYYQAMIADGHLDPQTVTRVVTQAGQEISSDYDLAELLVLVAQQYPLAEPTRTAFVQAAEHIESDYDRHRVLAVVLAGKDLSDDLASAVLGAAAGIESDYDLAEVLVVLIQKHSITAGMSEAFFKAVDAIESDYDRRRVLAALLDQRHGAGADQVAAALRAAGHISSDYDRAEVLVQVAGTNAIDDALRGPYFAAADGIGSDYDHARVLKAVLERGRAPAAVVGAVIASTRSIGSDYNRAEVLVAVARNGPLTSEQRRAFVEAAQGIGSEYDRNRALAALGGNTPL
jgi:beta-lactamase regulating signal transducer with metallopeptidase domain